MFVSAIERAAAFTRPIHFITRYYGTTDVHPGAATLFFVNADGWALTCRHVAAELAGADQLLAKYNEFKAKRAALRGNKKELALVRALETAAGIARGTPIELYWLVMGCIEGTLNATIHTHPTLDVALIHFTGYDRLLCNAFPRFGADDQALLQGKSLCRLGFPFPEFTNYAYDEAAERIVWTDTGRAQSPRFPIDGMLTRHLLNDSGAIVGFEMSTPGLRGQSGGPAFDTDGTVWGMQAATRSLDLNFDTDIEVKRGPASIRVREHALLHVGHCVHVSVLKEFMRSQNVAFSTA